MSKRDQLGTGRFGGSSTTGVSARRQAVADATGVATTGAADSRLRTLPLEQLVPTRFNPRRNFGTDKELKDFGLKLKTKQLQPAVAVTREAYLKLWEDEADAVGTHRYVIANGERRYRGSQAAGLETLEVIVDDTIAETRATFLDAVLSENNDREDLDPVEQAIGIQTMVDQLGGKAKVAEHYGKSAGWVTQQLYLLKLAPELQQLVSAGTLPVRETRALIKLPVEDQASEWERRLLKRDEPKPQPSPAAAEPSAEPETFTAVKNEGTSAAPTADTNPAGSGAEDVSAEAFTAVKNPTPRTPEGASRGPSADSATTRAPQTEPLAPAAETSGGAGEGLPGQRAQVVTGAEATTTDRRITFPYDNGPLAAGCLNHKMPLDEYRRMQPILVKDFLPRLAEQDPESAASFIDDLQAQLEKLRQEVGAEQPG